MLLFIQFFKILTHINHQLVMPMKNIIKNFIISLIVSTFSLTIICPVAAADTNATADSYELTPVGMMLLTGGIIALPALLSSSAGSSSSSVPVRPCPSTLQTTLDAYRIQHNIPAISLSISPSSAPNQPTYNCYSGTYAKDSSIPITANSRFAIASLTKAVVSTVILKLEEQKKININDPIGNVLQNEYTDWSAITIKQLLNMTAGVAEYFDYEFNVYVQEHPDHFWSLREIINHIYPETIPDHWKYINTNYELAGLIIEKASGKSAQENLNELIFKPLNMTQSIYEPATLPRDIPNMVRGYTTDDGNPFYYENVLDFSLSMASTAGGIISTPADYLKFIRALFSGRLIPNDQLKELQSIVCQNGNNGKCELGQPISVNDGLYGYGLGVEWVYNKYLGKWYWWHSGTHSGGYHNTFAYIPQNGFSIVIFTDLDDKPSDDYDHFNLVAKIYTYFHPRA